MNRMCLLLSGCLLFGACGPADPTMPMASEIEDVPVPSSAEPGWIVWPMPEGAADDRALFAADRQGTYVVPGISGEGLLVWYEEQLPAGQAWQEWAWCERPSSVFQRIYYQPGTNRTLALKVLPGERPGVLIVQHDQHKDTGC